MRINRQANWQQQRAWELTQEQIQQGHEKPLQEPGRQGTLPSHFRQHWPQQEQLQSWPSRQRLEKQTGPLQQRQEKRWGYFQTWGTQLEIWL
jgi:hypothetical protein